MRFFKGIFLLYFLFLFSCETDVPSGNDSNMDSEDPMVETETESIILVNAFPNLSFDQPLDFQAPEDTTNRVFVAEKGGAIRVFDNNENASEATIFLDLRGTIATTSEQGLLGFAFHPNFQNNGHVFVCYTPTRSLSVISRFTVSGSDINRVDLNSELILLQIPQPFTNHNGGQIAFGPDGSLYIAMGDGGGSGDPQGNAQDTSNLLGNILRIDVDNAQNGLNYAIPLTNPFVNDTSARAEIYAYGLRNPWRMSFDTATGDLWTGDVGQNEVEEINSVEPGRNYGWNFFEGNSCFLGSCNMDGLTGPIFEYNQDNGDRSVTGGYVYRGANINTLVGSYIYGDFVSGRVWALSADGSENQLLLETGLNIASFGTDADQELYFCAFNGTIYKFSTENNN